MELIERICALVANPRALSAAERSAAVTSFADTIAVTYAGWGEPSARILRGLYGGPRRPMPAAGEAPHPEHVALVLGTAGHALDYDDVHLTSVTHPSVVMVPALLALLAQRPELAARVLPAYAVGLGTNIALGEALGFSHYSAGWHATSTIGPVAGAAAVSHLLGLDARATRSALALAAAQAGGFQRNFGTMGKHVQAGQAAAAGLRAALMAEAGVEADADIFGPKGYLDLYAGAVPGKPTAQITVEPDTLSVSRKLFPCCYLTHRMIGAALEAHRVLPEGVPAGAQVIVEVPYGGMSALRVSDPKTGAEAKFCAAYCVSTALLQGRVRLADFTEAAVHRPEIRRLMAQVETREDALDGPVPVGIDHGTMRLRVVEGNRCLAETEMRAYPGAPDAPLPEAEFAAKLADCLAIGGAETGETLSPASFVGALKARIDPSVLPIPSAAVA